MKLCSRIVLAGFVMLSAGCAHRDQQAADSMTVSTPVRQSRVLNAEKLRKGGQVLVVPFSAGAGVAADYQLDMVSFQIIRGLADTLEQAGSKFQVLDAANAQSADLVVRGRIIRLQQAGGVAVWPAKKRPAAVSVEGSVIVVDSQDIIAKFALDKPGDDPSETPPELGYRLGTDIGKFILQHSG